MAKSDESTQKNWNYTVTASTRLSDQTSDELEQYRNQEDIGKSEALRRLIRTGLDQQLDEDEEDDNNTGDQATTPPHDFLIYAGLVFVGLVFVGDPVQEFRYLAFGTLAAGIIWRVKNE